MDDTTIHLELDAPTSLHGNGAASFALTTRDPAEVSCELCLYLWQRNPLDQCGTPMVEVDAYAAYRAGRITRAEWAAIMHAELTDHLIRS